MWHNFTFAKGERSLLSRETKNFLSIPATDEIQFEFCLRYLFFGVFLSVDVNIVIWRKPKLTRLIEWMKTNVFMQLHKNYIYKHNVIFLNFRPNLLLHIYTVFQKKNLFDPLCLAKGLLCSKSSSSLDLVYHFTFTLFY